MEVFPIGIAKFYGLVSWGRKTSFSLAACDNLPICNVDI